MKISSKSTLSYAIALLQLLSLQIAVAQVPDPEMDQRFSYIQENLTNKWQELAPDMYAFLAVAKNHPQEQYLADAYNFLGALHFRKSNTDSALYYYTQASVINRRLENELALAKNILNIGMTYRNLGEFEKTIEYSLEAARVFEKIGDYKGMAIVYNMVGSVHYYLGDYDASIEAMHQYVTKAEQSGDSTEIGSAYQNLSAVLQAAGQPEAAIPYRKMAMELFEKTGNLLSMGNNAIQVGTAYLDQGDFDQAETYLLKAAVLGRELQNPRLIVESNFNLGVCFLTAGKPEKSLEYYTLSLETARLTDDNYFISRSLNGIALSHYDLQNFQLAYDFKEKYQEVNNKIMGEENLEKIAELEKKYETEQKESQIARLESERALQGIIIQRNRILQGLMGGSLLLIVVLGFVWQSRQKSRQKEQLRRVELMLREEQLAAVISSQESERRRFAEDLHDGFGQLISALKVNIGQIEREKNIDNRPERRHELYENSVLILDEMYDEVRNIAFNLMPAVLVKKGLVAAVEQLAERISQSGQMSVQVLAYDMKEKLDELQEISLYRIIQETINNIVKYAQADKIEVQFVKYEEEIVLTIEDNGLGFDPVMLERGNGNGWKNICSRLNLVKGKIDIDSTPDRAGTTYVISIPVEKTLEVAA